MNLSDLIEEFIEMKLEGPPERGEWISLAGSHNQYTHWCNRLQEIKNEIDKAVSNEST